MDRKDHFCTKTRTNAEFIFEQPSKVVQYQKLTDIWKVSITSKSLWTFQSFKGTKRFSSMKYF